MPPVNDPRWLEDARLHELVACIPSMNITRMYSSRSNIPSSASPTSSSSTSSRAPYHIGQVVSYRRAAGNPIDPAVQVYLGIKVSPDSPIS